MEKLEADILEILQEDCRTTPAQVAVMLGEDEERVKRAIASLEKRGTLVKYAAIVNLEEEEDECVEAFVEVTVTPQSGSGYDGIAAEIAQHPEVVSLYLMSGAYDFAVILRSRSVKSISAFISECIATFQCVTSTATHFILKKYKIEGAVTEKKNAKRRLSVQA